MLKQARVHVTASKHIASPQSDLHTCMLMSTMCRPVMQHLPVNLHSTGSDGGRGGVGGGEVQQLFRGDLLVLHSIASLVRGTRSHVLLCRSTLSC